MRGRRRPINVRQFWRLGTAFGVLLTFSPLCDGATLTVDVDGSGDHSGIQPAIDAAADGDTVLVLPGEYVVQRSIDFNRLPNPDDAASPPVKNLTLRSQAGPAETIIRMDETPDDPRAASSSPTEKPRRRCSRGSRSPGGRGLLTARSLAAIRSAGVVCSASTRRHT